MSRFVVIGGAGAMGRITVRDLYEFSSAQDEVVIADYDLEKAKSLALSFESKRVQAVRLDVRNLSESAQTLTGATVVINCVQYQLNIQVMEACLAAKTNYVDLGGLFHVTRKQLELHKKFEDAGLLALIGMGAAPGITNILARVGSDQLDVVKEIHCIVGGRDQTKYKNIPALPVSYSLQTILEEFSMKPAVFTKGQFTFAEPMSGATPHRFPAPVGVRHPMFTLHSEVATLPLSFKDKGVQEVTFRIAFDPDFVEKVKFLRDLGMASASPIDLSGTAVRPIEVVNRVAMSQSSAVQVGKLKQHEIVRVIVRGLKKGKKKTITLDCHTKGFEKWGVGTDINTGTPPAIAALMIASGELKMSGVQAPENAVPPQPFIKHLKARKLWVEQNEKSGWV